VQLDKVGHRARRATPEHRVTLATQVLLVHREVRVQRDRRASWDLEVILDHLELRD
jgi:hypothetical protein